MARWDPRAWIALISVLGAFALSATQLVVGHPDGANIPSWAAGLVTGVNVFYFASKHQESRSDDFRNGYTEGKNGH